MVLFALSGTATAVARQLEQAAVLAASLRGAGSALPIALLTDVDLAAQPRGWLPTEVSCVINITAARARARAQSQGRAGAPPPSTAWASLWLLGASPFASTLALQGGLAACGEPSRLWPALREYDLLLAPRGGPDASEAHEPAVLAYRRGAALDALLATLALLLPSAGARTALYYAAQQAAADVPAFRVGALAPSWLAGMQSAYNTLTHAQSLVLPPGEVVLIALEPLSLAAAAARCGWLNDAATAAVSRLITWDEDRSDATMLVSRAACEAAGTAVCAGPGLSWDAGPAPQRLFASAAGAAARIGSLTAGVTLFGYSMDHARALHYVEMIRQTAWNIRAHNPALPIALFTNLDVTASPPFTHVVRISEADVEPPPSLGRRGGGWNILTRVRSHARSPYNLTVQIDSDRLVCGSLAPLFELLAAGWDVVGTSAGALPMMDHGVLAMRAGPRLALLLRAWAARIVERGDEGRDEQQALVDVRGAVPGLRIGFAPPTFQAKFAPASNRGGEECLADEHCIMHTLVLRGAVVVWAAEPSSLEESGSICRWVNADAPRARVAVYRKKPATFTIAFSQEECELQAHPYLCNHTEIRWEDEGEGVIPAAQRSPATAASTPLSSLSSTPQRSQSSIASWSVTWTRTGTDTSTPSAAVTVAPSAVAAAAPSTLQTATLAVVLPSRFRAPVSAAATSRAEMVAAASSPPLQITVASTSSVSKAAAGRAAVVAAAGEAWQRGRWVRNDSRAALTLYTLPSGIESHGGDSYFWETAGAPPFLPFSRAEFCRVLAGRTIVFLGDSVDCQFFFMLQMLAAGRNQSGCMRLHRVEDVICGGVAPARVFAIEQFVLNTAPMSWDTLHEFTPIGELLQGTGAQIVIVNKGAHWTPTLQLLRSISAALREVQRMFPAAIVIWRNTPHGHPNCSRYSGPLATPLPLEGMPFHWGEFPAQNAAVAALLAVDFPDVLRMDGATSANLRPELHASATDCLHQRYGGGPNPLETWVQMLYNILRLV